MRREIRVRTASVEDHLPGDLHPVLRRVYLNRGVGSAEELDLSLKRLLPFHSLKGMDAAVDLLVNAIEQNQYILIVGDFDADGATSTALAITALGHLGAGRVSYLVPDRFRFGYGLTPEIVEVALERKPDLIITVDNGISSLAGVAAAQAAGVKVLITDHHLPGADLPAAEAIVNPNQPGCGFPSKKLAGVGVIFYVMAALRTRLRELGRLPDPDWSPAELLDLVALGTVADVVPLDYNNRIFVHQGLQRIRRGRCKAGITALLGVANRAQGDMSAADLGFAIGPRLNAAGRLQDMSLGIECLLTGDTAEAVRIATELDEINQERRELQSQMQDEALAQIDTRFDEVEKLPRGLCLFDPGWHEGIVGLIASRLKERHHRPSIAFAPSGAEGLLKGSARSIPGLHIRDALDRIASLNPGLIEKFGGHAMAAGLSLAADQFDDFNQAFNEVLDDWLNESDLKAVVETEGEIAAETINLATAQVLRDGGPWGQGFPEPVFHGTFEVLDYRILKERHLKLSLAGAVRGDQIDAIAFNAVTPAGPIPGRTVSISYRIDINDYRGERKTQLIIEAIH